MGQVLNQEDWFSWSLNQFSREFGVARETVGKRISDAGINASGVRRGHSVYRVGEVAKAMYVSKQISFSNINDPNVLGPRDRLDHFKSENERIKFEKETGVLADVNECRSEMAEIAKLGLQILVTLPDILERDFNLDPEIIESIEEKIDYLRDNWAESLLT